MAFQFNKQSQLYGRRLRQELARYAFVPKNEGGLVEHIFVYRERVPDTGEEPDLFRGAKVIPAPAQDELELIYDGLREEVVLMTLAADDRFRKEHPDIVARNEMFMIDF
ncbi:MAG: hypothetical protein PHH00_03260 [Candidatus Nanoarchaeia archaeon]|nr:hypothetical protein [Candidatus Nanoarchaeia archaeon]